MGQASSCPYSELSDRAKGRAWFMSTTYDVPLEELLPAVKHQADNPPIDSSSSEEDEPVAADVGAAATAVDDQNIEAVAPAPPQLYVPPPLRRSTRQRQEPAWLRGDTWDRR